MSYRQLDKYYENSRNHNFYNNNNRNLNREFIPIPPRENTYYYDPRFPQNYHGSNYVERRNYNTTANQRYMASSSNQIRININNNHNYNNKLNLQRHANNSRKPTDRSTSSFREILKEKTYKNQPEIVKSIEKSTVNETTDTNQLETVKSVGNDSSMQETEVINKRKNVLLVEDAVKLSAASAIQPETITATEQPDEKKRKLDQSDTVPVISNKNPRLEELKSYNMESVKMKRQMGELWVDLGRLKKELVDKLDEYRELKIKRKSMKAKIKKICLAIKKQYDCESDSSNLEKEAESADEMMNTVSVVAVADDDGNESSSCSSHGSDVELVAVDETAKHDKVTHQSSSSSSSSSDSDSHSDGDDDSHSSCGSDVEVLSNPQEQPSVAIDSSSSDSEDIGEKSTVAVDADIIKAEQIQTEQSKFKKPQPEVKQSLSTSSSARNKQSFACANSLPLNKTETKVQNKNTIPECVDTSFMLLSPQSDASSNFPVIIKPDEENGLFHAIEPKLSTIIISDEDNTFITDIKVFNNRLFVSASHGLLRQYHLGTQECIMDYKGHQSLIHCLLPTVHPVGLKRILSGGFDKTLFVHNIDTGAILHKIEEESAILSICDLMDFVYYGTAVGNVATFSLEKNRRMSNFKASDKGISCITATKEANTHLLFVGANTGEYSVWNAITYTKLKIITPVSHIEIPIDFIVLQKQRILAYTRNHVHFIQYIKTKSTSTFNHFNSISSLCLTRNYAIIGAACGKVSVYKIKGSHIPKTPIRTITNSNSSVISLTFYNNTIITGDKTGRVYFNRLVES